MRAKENAEANRRLADSELGAKARSRDNQREALLERYRVAWAIFRGLNIFEKLNPHALEGL
jgi:hypothetical protein